VVMIVVRVAVVVENCAHVLLPDRLIVGYLRRALTSAGWIASPVLLLHELRS